MHVQSIYNYISNNLFNDTAAHRLEATIEQKLKRLEDFPETGTNISASLDDIAKEFSEFRKIIVGNYLVIYNYFKDEQFIFVTHIFHQMQNYGILFQ